MGIEDVIVGQIFSQETDGKPPVSAKDRKIENGQEFDKYFDRPNLTKDLRKRNGSVKDTVALMKVLVKTKSSQVRELAQKELAIRFADGSLNVYATVKNIFSFIFKYIKYNFEVGEQLQSPRHLWWRGQVLARENPNNEKNSGDCDCFSIFAGSCMYQLGIDFAFKIAGYSADNYQHVYCVAYDHGRAIICDPVTNEFDYEKPPVISGEFPISGDDDMTLKGTDIYVLDGIDERPAQDDGSLLLISGVGSLGKSDKKAKKAAKKQAKAEKKAEKKAAKAEKKAEKKAAKAEKKAAKVEQKAEKKAAKLEKKAEKKGGKKAEKLLKKAQTVKENAAIKAESIKDKAAEKAEQKQKKINEKLEKKTAKLEVKKLKAEGASKEEIKAAKDHLKEVKKEIKAAKKEDGRGFFRKIGKAAKSMTMLPVRAAFLMLLNINFRGFASRLNDNPEAFEKFDKTWRKVFGGKTAKLKIAVNKGKNHKALFGSKKTVSDVNAAAENQEVMQGILQGYFNQVFSRNLSGLGVEPTTTTAAAAMAAAAPAITALTKLLKEMGVNVPESVEDALEAGEDIAELFADESLSEDYENWENPEEYNDDEGIIDPDNIDTTGMTKKEARKAKKEAKKAAKKAKKEQKKADKAAKKAAKKNGSSEEADETDENSEEMADGKFKNFINNVKEQVSNAVNKAKQVNDVIQDFSDATKEVRDPGTKETSDSGEQTSKGRQQNGTTQTDANQKGGNDESNWFKEHPTETTIMGVALVGLLGFGIYKLAGGGSSKPQGGAVPTPTNSVPIQGIALS